MKSIENRLGCLESKISKRGIVTPGIESMAKLISEIIGEEVDLQELADEDRNKLIPPNIQKMIDNLIESKNEENSPSERFIPDSLRDNAPINPKQIAHSDKDVRDAQATRIMYNIVRKIPGARNLTLEESDLLEQSICEELKR